MFRQDFTCPALLEFSLFILTYGAITHYGRPFQAVPLMQRETLAWSPFARRY